MLPNCTNGKLMLPVRGKLMGKVTKNKKYFRSGISLFIADDTKQAEGKLSRSGFSLVE
jgi:hypothetical protein